MNFVIVGGDQPTVGDRTAGQVTCQVLHDLCGIAFALGWALDKNVPIGLLKFVEPLLSLADVFEKLNASTQLQLSFTKQLFQSTNVVTPKRSPKFDVVAQVRFAATSMFGMTSDFPLAAVDGWPRSGDQRVDVRVMLELLVSGVQYHQGGGLILGGTAKFAVECSPSTLEQQIIKFAAVTEDQRRELV